MCFKCDFDQKFGNPYPGHPLIVALYVFSHFEKASSALEMGKFYPRMMESNDVPGSGDSVSICRTMFRLIHEKKLPIQFALFWSDDAWLRLVGPGTGNFSERLGQGLKASLAARETFLEMAENFDWT